MKTDINILPHRFEGVSGCICYLLSFKLTLKKIVHWMSTFTVWTFFKCQLFILTRWGDLRDDEPKWQDATAWQDCIRTLGSLKQVRAPAALFEMAEIWLNKRRFERPRLPLVDPSDEPNDRDWIQSLPNAGFRFQRAHTGIAF